MNFRLFGWFVVTAALALGAIGGKYYWDVNNDAFSKQLSDDRARRAYSANPSIGYENVLLKEQLNDRSQLFFIASGIVLILGIGLVVSSENKSKETTPSV